MPRQSIPITIELIKTVHAERQAEIRARLREFYDLGQTADDQDLFAEMAFCFFTGGCSAKMGMNALSAIRPILFNAGPEELAQRLNGVHRYPNARAKYVAYSRDSLSGKYGLELRRMLDSFACPIERRDWLVKEDGIKGLGYKEASHYLRNIGYKGYAILDKHVLYCMAELKLIDAPKPPNTRSRYLTVEEKLKQLAEMSGIDFDELDLVLWSIKTGVILK